ncbi:MAG: type IV secretory system conjugative DNA transfer family protein [Flavobacteriales bacterium]
MKLSIKTRRKIIRLKQKIAILLIGIIYHLEEATTRINDWSNSLLESIQKKDHEIEDAFGKTSSILNRKFKGLTIDGRQLRLKKDQDRKGILISGSTGSGKTSKVVTPMLCTINSESSIIIHDPSKEISVLVAGYFQSLGYRIVIIDFADAKNSVRYNPLLRLITKAQFNAFAFILVSNNTKGKMDFWNNKAVTILVFLIELQKQLPVEFDTLHNLYHLTQKLQSEIDRESFDKLVVQLSEDKPELFTTYSSIVSMSENTLSGVLATLSNALSIYGLDENLARITSKDTLGELSKIRKDKSVVFIHSSTTKMEYYSPISTLFFNQYFDEFFHKLPDGSIDRDVYFVLDETPVLKIDNLDIIASNIRKYRGSLVTCFQSPMSQLTNSFGREKAKTIMENLNTHIYLSIDLEQATHLEKVLGTYTYKREDSEQKITRPLKTKTELMALSSKDLGIVTVTGKRPLLLKFTPFFKTPSLLRKTEILYHRSDSYDDGVYAEPAQVPHLNIEDYLSECSTQKKSADGQN